MKTDDIRLALERLQRLAARSHEEGWPSAIERDLMLAELRQLYDALLFAGEPAAAAEEPDGCSAEAEAVVAAAVAVAAAETTATAETTDEAVAESAAPELVEEAEPAEVAEPAEAVEVVETAEPAEAKPETEIAPAEESEHRNLLFDLDTIQHRPHRRMMSLYDDRTFDSLPETPASAAQPAVTDSAPAPELPSVEDAAETVAEPQVEVAPQAEEEPQTEQTVQTTAEPVAEVEPEPAPEAEPEPEVEASVDYVEEDYEVTEEPAAEEPELQTAADDDDSEEVVWMASDDDDNDAEFGREYEPEPEYESGRDSEFEPEFEPGYDPERTLAPEQEYEYGPVQETAVRHEPQPEPEPEPQPEQTPQPPRVRRVADLYSEPMDDEPTAAAASASADYSATAAVLGDVVNSNVEVLGDTLAPTTSLGDTLAHAHLTAGIASALDISERYQIISELFGGDADACDAALEQLDAMESIEDAVIYIEENFRWNHTSPATVLMMDLLERKFS